MLNRNQSTAMSSDYGTYRLTYTPPNDPDPHYPLISIDMSTSGDADVDQMLRFFEAFLAASGYVLKGELQVVERDPRLDYNPWGFTAQGPQATDFVPLSQLGDDVISFGVK
jgi:hypothetical protein